MTLNPAQQKAVAIASGPLLIIAGAGAGKTKTIAHRIARLIEGGVPPGEILAVTFTNKAASEMRGRIKKLLAGSEEGEAFKFDSGRKLHTPSSTLQAPFVSTFHALGAFIIREQARRLGLIKHFGILDRDESLSLIKQAMRHHGLEPREIEPRRLLNAISRAKGEGLTLARYREQGGEENYFSSLVPLVWESYEQALAERRALDFDDLLLRVVELWRREPAILEQYQDRWRHLHIDEYQDTNKIQYQLATLLAGRHRNLCVVGDLDQSIYGWRGADFRNLLNFQSDYPEAQIVTLEQNYRSTKTILEAANQVIRRNRERLPKKLFTENPDGERLRLTAAFDEKEEARQIAETSRMLIERGASAGEIAVLYRANFQSRTLESAFLDAGVPHRVLGTRFFDRQEVKDVLAYLKAALNPDDLESAKRVINRPARGIGKATMAKVFLTAAATPVLPPRLAAQVKNFQTILADIARLAEREKPSTVVRETLRRSGLEQMWREGSEEDRDRLETARELVTLALKYDPPAGAAGGEGIWQFLTDAALAAEQDSLEHRPAESREEVKLMTVHAAKGLEFDYVFITGLERDLFPHRALDDREGRDEEEERRLFYVALTRARKKIFLSYAESRTIFGARQVTLPSPFLGEIDASLMEAETHGGPSSVGYLIDF